MKIFLKIITALLLSVNGIGAIYGGSSLIMHPDGSGLKLPMDLLEHTPFTDYLIPGIILFIVNGVLSFITLACLLFSISGYPWLIIAQGIILTGWILIQIMLIQTIHFLHISLGITGILLVILGALQWKYYKEIHLK